MRWRSLPALVALLASACDADALNGLAESGVIMADDPTNSEPSLDGSLAPPHTTQADAGPNAAPADGAMSTLADSGAAAAQPEPAKCAELGATAKSCTTCTHQGWVQGLSEKSTCTFLGIPYAKPPIGPLRWTAPKPAEGWQGVREATRYGAACAQTPDLSFAESTSEDCLFLNVYAPTAAPKEPLPVMVFVHGGGYVGGAANLYGGKGLSERGPVVVVTLNYRVGPLGLFAHPELDRERGSDPSGSDAIRDQQLALRWVRDNVSGFGGDPHNVTLFGESAGAGAVGVHQVSPLSRGLVRRFILESGSSTKSPKNGLEPMSREAMYETTRRMAQDLCPGAANVMSCLRGLPVDQILAWEPAATNGDAGSAQAGLSWGPVVEGAGGVLPDQPEALIKAGRYNKGEILIGTNKNEFALFQLLPTIFSLADLKAQVESQFGARAAEIVPLYQAIAQSDPIQAYITMMTDIMFRCSARRMARMAQAQGETVYLYSFEEGSAAHADELLFVFGPENMAGDLAGALPLWSASLVADMQRYWVNFAYRGDPNGPQLASWPRYDAKSDRHMTLVDPPAASSGLQKGACDFWDRYVDGP